MTHAQKFNIKPYLKPKKARSLQIYRGLRFLKNHKRIEEGSKDFLVKMGGVIHTYRELSIKAWVITAFL